MTELHQPHLKIPIRNEREGFAIELLDRLWARYRSRMSYVQKYEGLVQKYKANFFNDHIAFRTIAFQNPCSGIERISRIFEALGYAPSTCYAFGDQHLSSIHFQHPHPQFPKIFISQLKTWELSEVCRKVVGRYLIQHSLPLPEDALVQLQHVEHLSGPARGTLLELFVNFFSTLPWDVPQKKDVLALNKESQFGAWVLLNGYEVNHFTALINSHGVKELDEIEKVVAAMKEFGIPMKKQIEGARASLLRQSSTEAEVLDFPVMEEKERAWLPWPYAYFEIIERPFFKNPETGKPERFEGFLGPQATNLFEMTKKK